MKPFLPLILFCLIILQTQAQNNPEKSKIKFQIDSSSVLTLDGTLKSLYNVISGEKGVERNWKQFKYLFHPDAKLIPSGKTKEGVMMVRFLKPEDYIKNSGKWLVDNGFFEKEIHRKVDSFGNITQVFSTYESFRSEADLEPFMRGINSIQLFHDSKRWWIINIYWAQETEANPIPKTYLN
ncbi:hypothetical protein [Litoribaculum gwangyangense]|uniref:SnoaL-like domain-containing protein n=1 Tax=Litoribaculum gwangyangense TaxID=1130722 RepID=A0ABP9CNU7_9FLAO